MKRLFSLITAFILAAATTASAQQISGSAHDFSAAAWNSTGEICIVCHAPHNNQSPAGELIWNRTASAASYTMYSNTSGTFQAAATIAATPNAESKVCLSCHDGTVALESFGGNGAVTTTVMGDVNAAADVGSDLSDDHPISFDYTNALATSDGDLATPGDNGTAPDGNMPLFGATYRMECATCHDVHNDVPVGNASLLYVDNAASALCLTCHTK
jgi:hypothetical protein